MFLRFVIDRLDPNSGRRQGLFHAGKQLIEAPDTRQADVDYLISVRDWFNENLEKPERLALSSRPHAAELALSWFRDTATEHIRQMRDYQRVLEAYGENVTMLRTFRPGYIVYEDEHQIAAYPFAETPT